jgi:hypothetical protein
MNTKRWLMLTAAATLAGCTYLPPTAPATSQNPPAETSPVRTTPPVGAGVRLPDSSIPTSGATVALLTRSRDQREAGDLGGAAATVERALTIAPDDAELWVELGEIRMSQGDFLLAEEMARKALTLTGDNMPLAARARRLISR